MKHSILCVDDEVHNIEALERVFRKKYQVFTATSGDEGLEILKSTPCSLIITDQRMPKMSGVQFLKKSVKICPSAIRILLTGYTDIDAVISAINSGEVYRYITKPWDPVDLKITVDKAIEKYDLREELATKNIALQKALTELKSLDQAKNQFMVLINHELKTPLTVLLSFISLLQETSLASDQLLYLEKIQQSGQKLHQIIDDVLHFVTAETGQLKTKKSKIKFDQLVDGLDKKFSKIIATRSLSLSFEIEPEIVNVDPELLSTVVHHLIKNAVNFAKKGTGVHLSGSPRVDPKGEKSYEFKISNDADQLSANLIEKLLKPFNLNENMLNHTKGMGLGLSLCQAILKNHDTELIITSDKKQFHAAFLLPII